MNDGTDSVMSALSIELISIHSEKNGTHKLLKTDSVSIISLSINIWIMGCEAPAIGESSGKLHLSESAVQCLKCFVLNKLALGEQFP